MKGRVEYALVIAIDIITAGYDAVNLMCLGAISKTVRNTNNGDIGEVVINHAPYRGGFRGIRQYQNAGKVDSRQDE